jgi:hypothetical protein
MTDFSPGAIIERRTVDRNALRARYTVADPVRDERGYLRMHGPHGRILTAMWHPDDFPLTHAGHVYVLQHVGEETTGDR